MIALAMSRFASSGLGKTEGRHISPQCGIIIPPSKGGIAGDGPRAHHRRGWRGNAPTSNLAYANKSF